MERTIIGVFTNRIDAEGAINELKQAGVDFDKISYVAMSTDNSLEFRKGDHKGKDAAEGAAAGAATGAVLGTIAGLVVANGVLPGLGTLLVAGPLAGALGLTGAAATTAAGAITGAVAGGFVGALAGLGIRHEDTVLYEERLRKGDLLIIVNSSVPGLKEIFEKYNAQEIREYMP